MELNKSVHILLGSIFDVYFELLPRDFVRSLPGLISMVDLETGVCVNQSYIDRAENNRSKYLREALRILLPSEKFGSLDVIEETEEGMKLKLPNLEACHVMNNYIKVFSKLPQMMAVLFSIVCSPLRGPETGMLHIFSILSCITSQ